MVTGASAALALTCSRCREKPEYTSTLPPGCCTAMGAVAPPALQWLRRRCTSAPTCCMRRTPGPDSSRRAQAPGSNCDSGAQHTTPQALVRQGMLVCDNRRR
jgi:hypothetical protein